jgi:MFS family permease
LQAPVLPYLVKSLGADANGYGRLMTAFGVVQFFGGLAAGPLADTLGGEVLVRNRERGRQREREDLRWAHTRGGHALFLHETAHMTICN